MNIGDKVGYVPHEMYALQRDIKGDYPWLMGWKGGLPPVERSTEPPNVSAERAKQAAEIRVAREQAAKGGQPSPRQSIVRQGPEYMILEGKKLNQILQVLRSHPKGQEEKEKNLVLLRPLQVWDATITSVNDDETVNLDVKSCIGGVTLHLRNIQLDHNKQKPHTCHPIQEQNA